MFGAHSLLVGRSLLGRWCRLAVLVACLGVLGCTNLNLRGDPFPENELSTVARQMRQVDDLGQSHAFSNKARQIEQDLGGSRTVSSGEDYWAP
jgi:hypothetical protein